MAKILFVGFATIDLIGGNKHLGGAAGAMSLNASSLGIQASLFAPLSRDENGSWYLDALNEASVDTSLCSLDSPSIPSCEIIDPHGQGSTRIWKDNGALAHFSRMDIRADKLNEFDAIMLCNIPPQAGEMIAKKMTQRKIFYIPGPACVSDASKISAEILKKAEIVFGNDEEAVSIWKNQPFSFGVQKVVITEGSNGGKVYESTDQFTSFESNKVTSVKDTTGAGDCLALGFTHTWIETHSQLQSIRSGTQLASQIIQTEGALL